MSSSMRTTLLISLIVNLLLAGILFGHLGGSLLMPSARQTPEQIEATLPADRRAAFHAAVAEAQQKAAPLRTQIDEVRASSLCILGADPFDREAYVKDVAQLHKLHAELIQVQVNELNDHAEHFTPQERIAFMDLLRPSRPPVAAAPCQHEAK